MVNISRCLKIYLVEDEIDLCGMLALRFNTLGHQVFEFSTTEDFLEAFHSGHVPDILITDIRFPFGMNGRDLLKIIKRKDPFHPPVIIITAYEDYPAQILYNDGAESIFIKPFDLREMELTVNRLTLQLREKFALDIKNFSQYFSEYVRSISTEEILGYRVGRGGLCITTSKRLSINEIINFTLNIREMDSHSIEITGVVRWHDVYTHLPMYGIEIIRLDSSDLFIELLEKTKPTAYIPKEIINS